MTEKANNKHKYVLEDRIFKFAKSVKMIIKTFEFKKIFSPIIEKSK